MYWECRVWDGARVTAPGVFTLFFGNDTNRWHPYWREIKSRLNSGNAFCHWLQSRLSSLLLYKHIKIKICKAVIFLIVYEWEFGLSRWETQIVGATDDAADEIIWTSWGGGNIALGKGVCWGYSWLIIIAKYYWNYHTTRLRVAGHMARMEQKMHTGIWWEGWSL